MASKRDPFIVQALTTLAGVLSPSARAPSNCMEGTRGTSTSNLPDPQHFISGSQSFQVPARVRAQGGESKGRFVYSKYPIKSIAVWTIFHFNSLLSITMSNPDIHWVFTIHKSALRLTSQCLNLRCHLDRTDDQK